MDSSNSEEQCACTPTFCKQGSYPFCLFILGVLSFLFLDVCLFVCFVCLFVCCFPGYSFFFFFFFFLLMVFSGFVVVLFFVNFGGWGGGEGVSKTQEACSNTKIREENVGWGGGGGVTQWL